MAEVPGRRGSRGTPTRVAGREVLLTRTEARLLEALRGRPGDALTRAELMALAMPGAVVLERTIDVHVKAIRRKLGPAARCLQTVRKVGYRFVPPEVPAGDEGEAVRA